MKTPLPPDPEECNDSRAEKANEAVIHFARIAGITGEEPFTQVQDLLCNLMHWADRTEGVDFDDALVCARIHYGDETCDDSDPEGQTYMAEDDDDEEDPEAAPFVAQYWETAAKTPLDEALAALDALMTATVDNCLSDGIELTEAEADAREKALAVFSKYGKGGK